MILAFPCLLMWTCVLGGSVPQDTVKKPTVIMEDTVLRSMVIVTIRDTAVNLTDMPGVFGKDYGELFTYIHQQGLTPGKVMARYYSVRPPFILDVAVEVDKFPTKTQGRIKINKIDGGNVIIAHYKGPYDQIGMAYTALERWLKEKNRAAAGRPFEVYIDDPASVPDPYELRTDIYQLFSSCNPSVYAK